MPVLAAGYQAPRSHVRDAWVNEVAALAYGFAGHSSDHWRRVAECFWNHDPLGTGFPLMLKRMPASWRSVPS